MVDSGERGKGTRRRPIAPTARFGDPVPAVTGPDDLRDWDPAERLGDAGAFPFTRGVYPTMYRGRLWTMRQFAGFGTPRRPTRGTGSCSTRARGTQRRIRHAHPDGTGLRRSPQRGRGGSLRRRDRLARGLRDAVRRDPARRHHDLDDDQRPRDGRVRFFLAAAERQGVDWASWTARCRQTSSRSTSHRRSGSSRPGPICG